MLELAPHLNIVDVTHDVAPFDVRAGALTLVRAIQYLPSGVVLAIADQLGLPISVVGLGEGLEDWEAFDPEIFARGLFE